MTHQQLVPGFITQFHPTFPVGFENRDAALEYEQASLAKPNYVPELIFIDRRRVIRAQYSGCDDFFKDQDKSIRGMLDTLLKEPERPGKNAHPTHKARLNRSLFLRRATCGSRCAARPAGPVRAATAAMRQQHHSPGERGQIARSHFEQSAGKQSRER